MCYTYLYTLTCIYLPVYTYLYTLTCIYLPVYTYLYILTCIHLPVYTYLYILTCIYLPVYTYLYIHNINVCISSIVVLQDGHEICFVGDKAFRELSQLDPKADELLKQVNIIPYNTYYTV